MSKIEEGELAVKLTSDITGGLGAHKSGAVLRNLTESAYIGLVNAGGHEPLKAGTQITDAKAVDTTTDPVVPAPDGKKS
jgi:hypothetical protein